MYCLKCGKPTGTDSEFCEDHADAPVTEQSVKVIAEEKEEAAEANMVRCPACNQMVCDDEGRCPACGAKIPATTRP